MARLLDRWRWRRRLPEELGWWRDHPVELAAPVETNPSLVEVVARVRNDPVRVLDVGAGPISSVPTVIDARAIDLTPVDVLADEYNRMLAGIGVVPAVATVKADAERLLATFGPASFDITQASNALDHAANPIRVLEQMVAVTRPGGFVVLGHWRNEAEISRYAGVHRWNFDVDEAGRLLLWTRGRDAIDVDAALGLSGRHRVEVREGGGWAHDWVASVFEVAD